MLFSLSQIPSPHQLYSFFFFFTHGSNLTIEQTKGKEYRGVFFSKMYIYFNREVIGQERNEKNVEGASKALSVVYLSRIKPQAASNVLLWPEA